MSATRDKIVVLLAEDEADALLRSASDVIDDRECLLDMFPLKEGRNAAKRAMAKLCAAIYRWEDGGRRGDA